MSEYNELSFKIGDNVLFRHTDSKTNTTSLIESVVDDILCFYDPFTFDPCLIVTVKNDSLGTFKVNDWRTDIVIKQ